MKNLLAIHQNNPRHAYLQANSAAYEALAQTARRCWEAGKVDETLHAISKTVAFACAFHPGRFADGALENMLLDIASKTANLQNHSASLLITRSDGRRRVLHVASHVLRVGGHTRMLHHWIEHDPLSRHSLIITDQGSREVPSWLLETLRNNGGDLFVCSPTSGLIERASMLRSVARQAADLVVLHHDAGDVVPVIALAHAGGPAVAVLNHADHLFWLGSSIADTVVSLRSTGAQLAAARRFARHNAVLPIPLRDSGPSLPQADARRALGIPLRGTVLLSVGRAIKYQPCGKYDFMSTAYKILEDNSDTYLYIIGATTEDMAAYSRYSAHERLIFVGEVDDPMLYRVAADIYLESFPFGSNTALLEAALCGLPVVPACAPLSQLLVAGNDALADVLPNPIDERAYIERTNELIQDVTLRIAFGKTLRERLLREHVGESWTTQLIQIYQHTDSLRHESLNIPPTVCEAAADDIGLSWWNVVADGRTKHADKNVEHILSVLRHSAFVEKYAGNYSRAQKYAAQALLCSLHDSASWRLFIASITGPLRNFMHTWMQTRSKLWPG